MQDIEIYKRILNHDIDTYKVFIENHIFLFHRIVSTILIDDFGNAFIEDCIAEALAYIWFNIHLYNPDKYSLKNWAALVVRTQALMMKRKLLLQKNKYKDLENVPCEDVEETLICKETYDTILVCINGFKEPMREIMTRKCINGENPKSIASEMNIDIKKVYYYIYEGTKKLKGAVKYE